METPNCYMEEKVINDRTCTNTVQFSCKRVNTSRTTATTRMGLNVKNLPSITATTSLAR